MNLRIREFKLTVENYIENIDLPEEVKRMVLKEIYENIINAANEAISAELNERESQKERRDNNE